jgi:DNA invertase Pin-like site-specific DNA recombinase
MNRLTAWSWVDTKRRVAPTRSGLIAARQAGRIGGRRPKLTPRQQQEIIHLVDTGQKTAADAARLFNVHPSTVAKLMARSHSAEGTSA